MWRPSKTDGTSGLLTHQEISRMQEVLEGNNVCIPARSVVQDLAQSLSGNECSEGERVLPWRQVSQRLQNESASSKARLRMKFLRHDSTASSSKSSTSSAIMPTASSASSASSSSLRACSMRLEAKSARDGAWFDVGAILSHRVGMTGRPEVHVRFVGFRAKDDEWVDVRTSLRERSLPCEASDCVAILPGDLVLCFQERLNHALHFDADVQEVKRRRHDARGCRCRFLVCYRHDRTSDVLPLRKICRRPESDLRIHFSQKKASYAQASRCLTSEAANSINAPPALETFPPEPISVICMQAVHSTSATSSASVLVVTSEGIPQAIIFS
ncbi:hypothetical protein Mapa_013901 [Marchantia paleacea]|nr:hypothetical protein Mapa_013901 [Marchantia paleacea]